MERKERILKLKRAGGSAMPAGYDDGMTMLDYFAGQALASMDYHNVDFSTIAQIAYQTAEAMLRERRYRWDQPLTAPLTTPP
jgi:hypothetical protein